MEILALVLFIAAVYLLARLLQVKRSIPVEVDRALKEFKKRSGRVRVGTTVEQLVPFVREFPYDPSDVRILSGGPVDYVVFDGLCEGSVRELVFLDVKTGTARPNEAQKQVKICADRGLVRFEVFGIDADGRARVRPLKSSL